jgi:hypothetical protein
MTIQQLAKEEVVAPRYISFANYLALHYAPVFHHGELTAWEPISRTGNWKTTEEVVREWENQNQTS